MNNKLFVFYLKKIILAFPTLLFLCLFFLSLISYNYFKNRAGDAQNIYIVELQGKSEDFSDQNFSLETTTTKVKSSIDILELEKESKLRPFNVTSDKRNEIKEVLRKALLKSRAEQKKEIVDRRRNPPKNVFSNAWPMILKPSGGVFWEKFKIKNNGRVSKKN